MDEKLILGRDLSPLISVSFKSHNLYDFIVQLIWKFLQPEVDHQYNLYCQLVRKMHLA
jgi:hypothetical protein